MSEDDESLEHEEHSDFVPAVFARDVTEAEEYRELLEDHDIPAMVGTEEDTGGTRRRRMSRGVPVLVPEALLDEASEVIAECEDSDEFESGDEEEELLEEEDEEFEFEEEDDDLDEELEEEFEDEESEDELLEDDEEEEEQEDEEP